MLSENKFYIGQKVQFDPKESSFNALPGATAKVVSLEKLPQYLTIKWVRNRLSEVQDDGNYYPDDFNIEFKPLQPLLAKALQTGKITNLEYFELLTDSRLKK